MRRPLAVGFLSVRREEATFHPEEGHLIESIITPAVDTTGVGDAFAAGFLCNASFVAFGHGLAELGVGCIARCGSFGDRLLCRVDGW
jgi:fructose-1-phosphate kinase PfkB-like protein